MVLSRIVSCRTNDSKIKIYCDNKTNTDSTVRAKQYRRTDGIKVMY